MGRDRGHALRSVPDAEGLISEILAVTGLAGLAWLWVDSLRAREGAVDAARRACASDGVQLLDDTVMLASLHVARVGSGPLVLHRVYHFEFSDTGNNRLAGAVTLAGARVDMLYLEPHHTIDVAPRIEDRWPAAPKWPGPGYGNIDRGSGG